MQILGQELRHVLPTKTSYKNAFMYYFFLFGGVGLNPH
jgi:hypothetical protein